MEEESKDTNLIELINEFEMLVIANVHGKVQGKKYRDLQYKLIQRIQKVEKIETLKNKKQKVETLCGKPHNNADETCIECEIIKAKE